MQSASDGWFLRELDGVDKYLSIPQNFTSVYGSSPHAIICYLTMLIMIMKSKSRNKRAYIFHKYVCGFPIIAPWTLEAQAY